MRKYIILFAAVACFTTALQAQTITKVLGKQSTAMSSPYTDLETDTLFYSRTISKIYNLKVFFAFEFTNGNKPMNEGDSIKIRGRVGGTYFPDMSILSDSNMYRYALTKNLAPGESILIKISEETVGEELINDYYSGGLLTEIYADSAYAMRVCGQVLYADNYGKVTNPTTLEKCVTAHLFKASPPPAVSESTMEKVKFYPNPVSNNLNITNLNNTNIEIYNLVGQRIVQYENISGDFTIEMKEYPDGIYFVKLQNGKSVRTEKIKVVK